jgi:hypothetical protein
MAAPRPTAPPLLLESDGVSSAARVGDAVCSGGIVVVSAGAVEEVVGAMVVGVGAAVARVVDDTAGLGEVGLGEAKPAVGGEVLLGPAAVVVVGGAAVVEVVGAAVVVVVGAAVLGGASTSTMPFMLGWMLQW